MNEADVLDALQKRYPAPEWAFLRHVPAATGGGRRTCDALAINCYPSRGCETHGFEVKISKSDLKRELADPDKAEELAQYCHYWWIVAPKDLAVPVDSLPANWGLIAVDEASNKVVKKAAKLKPKAPSREFVAALARKTATAVNDPEHARQAVETALRKQKAELQRIASDNLSGWQQRAARAEKTIRDFETASGVVIANVPGDVDRAKRIGAVMKAIQVADPKELAARISGTANGLSQLLRDVEAAIARLRAAPPVVDAPQPERTA